MYGNTLNHLWRLRRARSEAELFESGFHAPFLFSLAAAIVTTLGLLVIRRREQWARRNATYFASFAAGVLIAASVLHLFPRAIGMDPVAPLFILGCYFTMHAVNRFLDAYVCDRPGRADFAIGLIPMIGIGFHSFVDGAIYTVTFSVSWTTGAIAAAGMVLHEFPEGIVTDVLLRRSGFNDRSGFLWAFLAAGLSTPAGTIVTYDPETHQMGLVPGSLAEAGRWTTENYKEIFIWAKNLWTDTFR